MLINNVLNEMKKRLDTEAQDARIKFSKGQKILIKILMI